jgi:hypothetical protein
MSNRGVSPPASLAGRGSVVVVAAAAVVAAIADRADLVRRVRAETLRA